MSLPNPAALPLEVRRAAWDALWRQLLQPVNEDALTPDDSHREDATFGRLNGMDLKLRRVRAGLRQCRVAQELGIPPSTLCDYENGRKPVSSRQGQRILEAIDRLSLAGGIDGGSNGRP